MKYIFLLLLFLPAFAQADALLPPKPSTPSVQEIQQLAEAELTFKAKNYPKAFTLYHPLAEKGNVFAEYQLGYLYLNGLGTSKDEKLSFEWFAKAASQTLPEAKFALGLMYYYGTYVAQDLDQAKALFQEAATPLNDQVNSPPAAYMMGYLSATGYGMTRNMAEALRWYTLASALGVSQAQYNIGLLYYSGDNNGSHIPQDYSKAFNYFLLAANQNNVKAKFMEGLMYHLGQGTSMDTKQAIYWYAQAAEAGLDVAQFNLGCIYYTGNGVPMNLPFAIQLITKAANNGLASAQYLLGYFAMNGIGMMADPQTALLWYQKSAQQGFGEAQFALGYFYYKGMGVQRDDRQALTWFFAAAKSGVVNAQYMIGNFYQNGIALAKDPKMAAYWYNQAAMQKMENAQLMLGLMYAQGQGVPVDKRMAYAWFDIAAASSQIAFQHSVIEARDELAKKMDAADILAAKRIEKQICDRMG